MKKLLAFSLCVFAILFCVSAQPARAAVAQVQNGNVNCFGTSPCAATYGSSNTSPNIDVVCVTWGIIASTGDSLASIASSNGNTYTVLTSSKKTSSTTNYMEIGTECAEANNVNSGAETATVTMAFSSNILIIQLYELSGQDSVTPIDPSGYAVAAMTSTNPSAGTATASRAGEFGIVVSLLDDSIGIPHYSAGSGWTLTANAAGGNASWASEIQAFASTGSVTGNFSTMTSWPWVASMILVQPPAAAGLGLRGSGIQTAVATSCTINWPSGTITGDLAVVFASTAYNVTLPSGWTSNYLDTGSVWNGLAITKVLNSTYISTGNVTLTAAMSYDLVCGIATFKGNPGAIRETDANSAQATNPWITTTSGAITNTDFALYFGSFRTSGGTRTINTALGSALAGGVVDDGMNAYGLLSNSTSLSGGALSQVWAGCGATVGGGAVGCGYNTTIVMIVENAGTPASTAKRISPGVF